MNRKITLNLKDIGSTGFKKGNLDFDISITDVGIYIRPHGYGDYCSEDGCGFPIMIEYNDGEPRVIVWGDIDKEDTTHRISLENANESLRTNQCYENNAPNE